MNIALLGYGKMGKAIERIAERGGDKIVLKIDIENRDQITDEELRRADVVIDFSTPAVAVENYFWCFRVGVPVVSGTTGWLERWDEVVERCREEGGAFFYSSNFSLGVNIFFHLNRWLAATMSHFSEYRVSLDETHHIHKLDAPSGTAITLAEDIIDIDPTWHCWELTDRISEGVIPIHSKREGEVPGIHTVTYLSDIDKISITHSADSRDGFARGAIYAAKFIIGKNGVFGMKDLLHLE